MSVQPKMHLSPFVLSCMSFDNTNSVGDQEGFLIGKAQKSVRREINDQSMFNTEEDLVISVYSYIPCGSYTSFYDDCGNVKESVVEEFLGERRNSVVGWYRYRRNVVAFPSAREMIIHKNLKNLFPGNDCFTDDCFVFAVFGSGCYPTTATHTFDYTFFIEKLDSFKSLDISLLNLGDTKSEYRSDSLSSSFINSSTFNTVLQIPWNFSSCWQTEDVVQQMHKILKEKCEGLTEELAASESVNSVIEQEVQKLDVELKSLTVKGPVEKISNDTNMNNTENLTPDKVFLPLSKTHAKLYGKRNLKDLIELNEELHPLYGKYFPQNRHQEPGCSFHFTGEVTGINYNFLPPKKKIKVILQERRRILDHDYDNAPDNNPPHQFKPETVEDSFESGGYLASDVPGYVREEEVQCSQIDEYEMAVTLGASISKGEEFGILEASGVSTSGDKMTTEDQLHVTDEPSEKEFLDAKKSAPQFKHTALSDEKIYSPPAIYEEADKNVLKPISVLHSPTNSSNFTHEEIAFSQNEEFKTPEHCDASEVANQQDFNEGPKEKRVSVDMQKNISASNENDVPGGNCPYEDAQKDGTQKDLHYSPAILNISVF